MDRGREIEKVKTQNRLAGEEIGFSRKPSEIYGESEISLNNFRYNYVSSFAANCFPKLKDRIDRIASNFL